MPEDSHPTLIVRTFFETVEIQIHEHAVHEFDEGMPNVERVAIGVRR
jgi:hypothetical protein